MNTTELKKCFQNSIIELIRDNGIKGIDEEDMTVFPYGDAIIVELEDGHYVYINVVTE